MQQGVKINLFGNGLGSACYIKANHSPR